MEYAPGSLVGVGRYIIYKEINRGGSAIVYEARDVNLNVKVALKIMNNQQGTMSIPVKSVKREVENASSLKHPHVVQLLDVFAEAENLILVWELIEGNDLLDIINLNGGKLSEEQAAFYFQQILRAVLFMHQHGFCHRDLKPENCMLQTNTQIVKLIDFGLSKHLDSAITLGIGTPDYMAPEMLTSLGARGAKAGGYNPKAVDTWALGVLLYLLLTGKYPFEDRKNPHNVAGTVMNIKFNRMHELPSSVSASCKQLILCLLEKDPHKRITLKQVYKNVWMRENALNYYENNKDKMVGIEPQQVLPMSWLCGGSGSSADSDLTSTRNSSRGSKSSRGSYFSFKSSSSTRENQDQQQQNQVQEVQCKENEAAQKKCEKKKTLKSFGSFLSKFSRSSQ